MFRFRGPATLGQWLVRIFGVAVALFLIWWLLHLFIL